MVVAAVVAALTIMMLEKVVEEEEKHLVEVAAVVPDFLLVRVEEVEHRVKMDQMVEMVVKILLVPVVKVEIMMEKQ